MHTLRALRNTGLGVLLALLAFRFAYFTGSMLLSFSLGSAPTLLLVFGLLFCWSMTVLGFCLGAVFTVFSWDAFTSLFDK